MENEIFIHLPFPYYHSDQLFRSMHANQAVYRRFGTNVPAAEDYRSFLIKILQSPGNFRFSQDDRKQVFRRLNITEYRRTFISLPIYPLSPYKILDASGLIPDLNTHVEKLLTVFSETRVHFVFGLVNPGNLLATLVQAKVFPTDITSKEVLGSSMYWFDALGACVDEFQGIKVFAWPHEEAHFLWPQILRFCGMVPNKILPPGSLDMLGHSLSQDGTQRLLTQIKKDWPCSEAHIQKVMHGCALAFPNPRMPKRSIRLPEWSKRMSDAFETAYHEDLDLIERDTNIQCLRLKGGKGYSFENRHRDEAKGKHMSTEILL